MWPDLTQVKPTMEVGKSDPSWEVLTLSRRLQHPKWGSLNLEEFNPKWGAQAKRSLSKDEAQER